MGILDRLKKQKTAERPAVAPTPTDVAARLAAARDEIVGTMATEYGKAIAGVRGIDAAGALSAASSDESRSHLLDYPIWGVVQLIERVSRMPENATRQEASEAARSAAKQWATENAPDVNSDAFLDALSDTAAVYSFVERIADACIDAFVQSLGAVPAPPVTASVDLEAAAQKVLQSRMLIGDMFGAEYWKVAQDVRHKQLGGELPDWDTDKWRAVEMALVEQPGNAIIGMIERASELPAGRPRNEAADAARSAARSWTSTHMRDVRDRDFLRSLESIMTCQRLMKDLTGVCVDAFAASLRSGSEAIND